MWGEFGGDVREVWLAWVVGMVDFREFGEDKHGFVCESDGKIGEIAMINRSG